jgi:predicted transcriptional regulator
MQVKDYMLTDFNTISPMSNIAKAVRRMVEKKTNSLVVVDDENRPVGTLSSYTLVRHIVPAYLKDDPMFSQYGREEVFVKYAERMKDKKVMELMHPDFHALSADDSMIEAASNSVMAERRISPVVDADGRLIGVITRTCIKNALFNSIYPEEQIDPKNGGYGRK